TVTWATLLLFGSSAVPARAHDSALEDGVFSFRIADSGVRVDPWASRLSRTSSGTLTSCDSLEIHRPETHWPVKWLNVHSYFNQTDDESFPGNFTEQGDGWLNEMQVRY